ncbi:MAG: phytoene desaturase [Candidatus Schekmanbacteria bacterium]|nr:MAG: phytoene desaturase [Candidatus Schekmanbacteria bacterium]
MKKKVIVIGAGPGGLTSTMMLANKGYDVIVFERQNYIGGRNSHIKLDDFTFDLGPTFLIMKFVLEEIFGLSGRKLSDYMECKQIDPLYRLIFSDGKTFYPTSDRKKMREQIAECYPGNEKGYDRYLEYEKKKYEHVFPCLKAPYNRLSSYLKKRFIWAIPYLGPFSNLFDYLGRYFDSDELKLAFTFQAKYLGMSPWKCPGTFSIISFIEQQYGIFHPVGGLSQITKAMAKASEEDGAEIYTSQGVKKIIVKNGIAIGVELESGEKEFADYIVINADFAYAMTNLFKEGVLKKYTASNIARRKYSCSAFMIYLGVDRLYDIPHHNIIFSSDYKNNTLEIAEKKILSEEPSIYVQNACVTDKTLAPDGKSTIYILVPVANREGDINWNKEKARYREKVLDIVEKRAGLNDLRKHIKAEKVITPDDWENEKFVYRGAIFNLAHSIDQMLYLRPHNDFEEVKNCYLVGGGTHPGSGLPTIIESGRISAELIIKRDA